MTKYLIFAGLIFGLGCTEKESVTITIVDIGRLDRVGIAKELSIINKYSPRVIGLDFLLTTDSLDKDIPLSEELAKTQNMIRATKLHNNEPFETTKWDSLEQYHPKFRFGNQGFTNVVTTDDMVIIRELPMRQYFRDNTEVAFSYLIATHYDFDRIKPKYKNGDEDFSFDNDSFGHYFKIISVKDLLSEKFDKNDLTDKIVLMGHVSDKEDWFYLDDSKTKKISGVEIHASVIRELLD
jgi:CHASE2 domain-containing sensor protein